MSLNSLLDTGYHQKWINNGMAAVTYNAGQNWAPSYPPLQVIANAREGTQSN